MRVWIGDVERVYPARWFFTEGAAKAFPGPHGAEASPWLKANEVNLAWGEIAGTKRLDRGVNPGYTGQCNVGNPQWFLDGHLPADIFSRSPSNVCGGCGPFPAPPYVSTALLAQLLAAPVFAHFEGGSTCFTSAVPFRLFPVAPFFLISNLLNFGSCGFLTGAGIIPETDECGTKLVARFHNSGVFGPFTQDNCFLLSPGESYGETPLSSIQLSPLRLEFSGVPIVSGTIPPQPGITCPGGTTKFVVTQ